MRTIVSRSRNHHFEGWRESRETSCATLCVQCFSPCFLGRLFADFVPTTWLPEGVPGGDPWRIHKQLFRLLFPPCLLWESLGSPGSPKHPPRTVMTPKSIQNESEGAKTTSQTPANEPNHLRNKAMDRSIDPGTVAGLPEAVGYTFIVVGRVI